MQKWLLAGVWAEWRRQRDYFLIPSPKMHELKVDGINVRAKAHQSKKLKEMRDRRLLKWKREKHRVYSLLGSLKRKGNKRATAEMCFATGRADSEGKAGGGRVRQGI